MLAKFGRYCTILTRSIDPDSLKSTYPPLLCKQNDISPRTRKINSILRQKRRFKFPRQVFCLAQTVRQKIRQKNLVWKKSRQKFLVWPRQQFAQLWWRLHEDEGQKWTAGTLGERSVESQCEIRSKTEINEKMNLS